MFTLEDLGVKHREARLSNGTRVVVFERPSMPVVARTTFLSGSRFDKKEGTSHFLEHMLVAGTKKFPSKDKLATYIEGYGGRFGASTGDEALNVDVAVGDPADLDVVFEVLHEMLFESRFDVGTLETERGSIFGELRNKKSNPNSMVWEIVSRLFFQDTPLAKSTIGSEETIKSIGMEDVKEFFTDNLTAERLTILVSGGVTLEEVVRKSEALLLLPSSTRPQFETLPIIRKESVDTELYTGKDQVRLVFGFRTVEINDKAGAALDIIAEVLGGGRACTLAKKLRYERGLVYSVSAFQSELADAGTWGINTSTANKDLQEVMDIISQEIRRVIEKGLTPEEVQFAKDKISKSKRMEFQTSGAWVGFHSHHKLLLADSWTLIDYLREIQNVTPCQTKQVAEKYFGSDKWYLAMCGDATQDSVKINL